MSRFDVRMVGGPFHGHIFNLFAESKNVVVPLLEGGYKTVRAPIMKTTDGYVALWPEEYDANKVPVPPVWVHDDDPNPF